MIRAFIAIELDEPLRIEIARLQEQLRAGLQGLRVAWVRPASMHVTLKFLGDIDESLVDSLHESVATATRDVQPIGLPLDRIGGFPRLQEPRSLWLGPDERWGRGDDARRLQALARAIDMCCARHSLRSEERPFTPHLTLGRIKTGERQIGLALAGLPAARQPLFLPPLQVSQVALMKSQLDSKGAIHTRLWQCPLARLS